MRQKYTIGETYLATINKANQTIKNYGQLVGWTVSGKAVLQNQYGCFYASQKELKKT